jgi:hypothetical protein
MVCPKPVPGEDEEDPKVCADQDEEEPIIASSSGESIRVEFNGQLPDGQGRPNREPSISLTT